MNKLTGLLKHLNPLEQEQVERMLKPSFTDIFDVLEEIRGYIHTLNNTCQGIHEDTFDALEEAWDNVRLLERECRGLLYGEGVDPRSELEKSYQEYRDLTKKRR